MWFKSKKKPTDHLPYLVRVKTGEEKSSLLFAKKVRPLRDMPGEVIEITEFDERLTCEVTIDTPDLTLQQQHLGQNVRRLDVYGLFSYAEVQLRGGVPHYVWLREIVREQTKPQPEGTTVGIKIWHRIRW